MIKWMPMGMRTAVQYASLFISFNCLTGCSVHTLMTAEKSYPHTEGQEVLKGIDGAITISRDEYGVPHIRTETEHDLWFAVGYVHAQDRLFQMDLMRHLGMGRMSEWFGEEAVAYDAFMKSLGFQERFEQVAVESDAQILSVARSYTEGVNAGVAALPELPVEYRLLGVEFEKWELLHSMSSTIINSWAMAQNLPQELVTLMLREKLDVKTANALWKWDDNAPSIDAYWDDFRHLEVGPLTESFRGMIEFIWGVDTPNASNNWAVAGSRTADGLPILANDPHMVQMVPSLWYAIEAKGGDLHIAGAMLAGQPFPATGHNEHVSWGVTNVMADFMDLAVVERVGEKGYILAGEQKKLREVKVPIHIKGKPTQEKVVYHTEVGPVITALEGTHLVALRWQVLEVIDRTGEMFYDIQKARTVEDVIKAAKRPSFIAQNLVAADTEGNIAWQIFGSIPKRKGYSGAVPYPASDPAYGWDGWLTDLPGEKNPEKGYLHTANAAPQHDLTYKISTAYIPPWRHDRIGDTLAASDKHTQETMAQLQLDWYDPHAAVRAPQLLEGTDPDFNTCSQILTRWDYESAQEDVGAAVWAVFQGELIKELLQDELSDDELSFYLAATIDGRSVLDAKWKTFTTEPKRSVENALKASCDRIKDKLGADSTKWSWGALHPLVIEHTFASGTDMLKKWNMPTAPYGGSHNTVNQSGYSWHKDKLQATWIASIRVITPMSDPGKATFIYPGGQSGHPGHPQYKTLYKKFLAGEQVPLFFHDEDVKKHTKEQLILVPQHLKKPMNVAQVK